MLDIGEECDTGDANDDSGECTTRCTRAVCGDGLNGPGEGCDDGNVLDGDECGFDCRPAGAIRWETEFRDPDRHIIVKPVFGSDRLYLVASSELRAYSWTGELLWSAEPSDGRTAFFSLVDDAEGSLLVVGGYIGDDLRWTPWAATIDRVTGLLGAGITLPYRIAGRDFHIFMQARDRPGPGTIVAASGIDVDLDVGQVVLLSSSASIEQRRELAGLEIIDLDIGTDQIVAAVNDDLGGALQFLTIGLEPSGLVERAGQYVASARWSSPGLVVWGGSRARDWSGPAVLSAQPADGSEPRWETLFGTETLVSIDLDVSSVYAGGTVDDRAWIGRYDAATGAEAWHVHEPSMAGIQRSVAWIEQHPDVGLVAAVQYQVEEGAGRTYSVVRVYVP